MKKARTAGIVFILFASIVVVFWGIWLVYWQGLGQGVATDQPIAQVEQVEELRYEVHFMGRQAEVNLQPVNQAAGFLHRNSFLIPAPLTFGRQVCEVIYLAVRDPALLRERVLG